MIYDDNKHVCIASFNEDIKRLTILINGMSKSHAMTGWRIGYAAAHEEIIKVMSNIQSHATSNPCSISQYASVVGLTGDQNSVEEMKKTFCRKKKTTWLIQSIQLKD